MTDWKAEYDRLAEAARAVLACQRAYKVGTDWYTTDCALNALERALPAAHPSCGAWHQVDTERVCTCDRSAAVVLNGTCPLHSEEAPTPDAAMLTKYAGIPGTTYHAIRERADAARVATERAEKAAQERIANVHSAAYHDGFTNGTEAERARCLAVEPDWSLDTKLKDWRRRIASGEPAK